MKVGGRAITMLSLVAKGFRSTMFIGSGVDRKPLAGEDVTLCIKRYRKARGKALI